MSLERIRFPSESDFFAESPNSIGTPSIDSRPSFRDIGWGILKKDNFAFSQPREDSPAGWPQDQAGSWWRRDGRPVAQWTRIIEAVK
jgi:hypothetical protein